MRTLSEPPAIGYQTKNCNAALFYTVNPHYHKKSVPLKNPFFPKKHYHLDNLKKGIGYVPVLGAAVGIHRIVKTVKEKPDNKIGQIARGALEIIPGAGLGLLGVDIATTLIRGTDPKPIRKKGTYRIFSVDIKF